MYIDTTWDQFKTLIDTNQIRFKYIETDDVYNLYGYDHSFHIKCELDKNPTDTTGLDLFNSTYKSKASNVLSESIGPFASKMIADKSIYKRAVGKRYTLSSGSNTLTHTVTFTACKITGLELIGGEVGDYVDLKILDTDTGTVSTIPNYVLNQFGFEVNVAAGRHREDSNYDADLFVGLQIQVIYNSISAKDIGLNYILHEVK
jgi:hypothetical protein